MAEFVDDLVGDAEDFEVDDLAGGVAGNHVDDAGEKWVVASPVTMAPPLRCQQVFGT